MNNCSEYDESKLIDTSVVSDSDIGEPIEVEVPADEPTAQEQTSTTTSTTSNTWKPQPIPPSRFYGPPDPEFALRLQLLQKTTQQLVKCVNIK